MIVLRTTKKKAFNKRLKKEVGYSFQAPNINLTQLKQILINKKLIITKYRINTI
jgi:hypothetical protein